MYTLHRIIFKNLFNWWLKEGKGIFCYEISLPFPCNIYGKYIFILFYRIDSLADASDFSNFILKKKTANAGMKNRLFFKEHCFDDIPDEGIFGNPSEIHWDGIHLRGEFGSSVDRLVREHGVRLHHVQRPEVTSVEERLPRGQSQDEH